MLSSGLMEKKLEDPTLVHTVNMDVLTMPDGTNHLRKNYVCFHGVKKGWLEGYMKVIGINGFFLITYVTGELLCVVGKDTRDQIYPIVWTVVCVENKENWKWFLSLLSDDINLGKVQGSILMSDQHKEIMKYIELMSPEPSNYLMEKVPRTWLRAYYQVGRCFSSVENRGCENFNAFIVEARKKPIITILEELRMYMMNKLCTTKLNGWPSDVSPEIRLRLNELKANIRALYMKTYNYEICPMNGIKTWPETNYIPPLPPKNTRMPSMPKTKRFRDVSEKGGNHRVSKKGKKISCSWCKVEGHNKKTCPTLDRPRPRKLPTKGENVKKMTIEVGSGSSTRMEGRDTQGTGENGTTSDKVEG
ncbi:unnamed protein product [Lactuca saligna]|uniref:MULE transposase domain-containing protein n=1 Tax=Lactuca saligna TaxID=75948 RepID=A0AA36DZ97_LACSI|nr:unnamed protein product [Lactuca saligna]